MGFGGNTTGGQGGGMAGYGGGMAPQESMGGYSGPSSFAAPAMDNKYAVFPLPRRLSLHRHW
jgi:hypothetical protein